MVEEEELWLWSNVKLEAQFGIRGDDVNSSVLAIWETRYDA